MESGSDGIAQDLRCLLWIARVGAMLIVAFSLLWVVGYCVSPRGFDPNAMEALELALFPFGMSIGYLIALRWHLFGGLLSLACLSVFLGVRQEPLLIIIFGFLAVPGVFFVFYGMYLRDQPQSSC